MSERSGRPEITPSPVAKRQLGVRVVVVERRGQPLQHIDLCGKPMERALEECCDVAELERDLWEIE